MVKRLRRSPLTAESGVRFPLGSPEKTEQSLLGFLNEERRNKKRKIVDYNEKIKGSERAPKTTVFA